ncbi:MAG: serine hydrolase domain-containing protein [Planctomycetota bacterium]
MNLFLPLLLTCLQQDVSATLKPIREAAEIHAMGAVVVTEEGVVATGFDGTHGAGREIAVDANSLFHLGSCTKAMTATLAATFIEEGKLSWDSTLVDVFPELEEGMHADWKKATLSQMLSHTAGAPPDLSKFKMLRLRVHLGDGPIRERRLDAVKTLSEAAPLHAPGSTYLYSNWGFVMAGAMMERAGDATWETLMRERLFEPLGMSSAGFGAPNQEDGPQHPFGHNVKGEAREGLDNSAAMGPAGTAHATMEDWGKFVQLHLQGAQGTEGLLLKPETFAQLHAARPGTNKAYGAGWSLGTRAWSKGPLLTHSGSNTWWFCTTWVAPAEGFAVLVGSNRGGDAAARAVDSACWALIQMQLKRAKEEDE